jgi:hypothetical protein
VPVGLLDFLLGNAYWKTGDIERAPALMKSGIDEMRPQLGWGHPTYVAALKQYRAVLVKTGRSGEAAEIGESIAKLAGSSEHANGGGLLGVNALR